MSATGDVGCMLQAFPCHPPSGAMAQVMELAAFDWPTRAGWQATHKPYTLYFLLQRTFLCSGSFASTGSSAFKSSHCHFAANQVDNMFY